MKIRTTVSKLVTPFIATICISLIMPYTNAYADYLVKVVPAGFDCCTPPCRPCCPTYKKHYKPKPHYKKRHHVKHKQYRCHRYATVRAACHYVPQHEIVEFRRGAPCGGGRYVNLNDDYCYAPDMSTGDDDPMVYPGMNIDN
jgi:hypothetical protein